MFYKFIGGNCMGIKSIVRLFIFILLPVLMILSQAHSGEKLIKDIRLPEISSKKIILRVGTGSAEREYTHADIESLGLKQIRTSTYWKEDDGVYQGVLLRDLLRNAGIEASKGISISALDGFTTKIPREDWENWPVLLATRRDGKIMSIRKKGPLRIIYPKDLGGPVAKIEMRIRWIWAIKSIRPEN
ncbi:molybdopterin-dependent oxidoreductase [Desulfospira joergensenii]|uniref:molybdopterin-dependent oxidoreductase n=1 Tax=Desulfospira joergensenii TaxID=53329 RepID=UPI0003B4AC50|nr:molybdopterin-dependent oxidoreductase [Desulfospira joergensenii]